MWIGGPQRAKARSEAPTASLGPQNYEDLQDVIFEKCGFRRGLKNSSGTTLFVEGGGSELKPAAKPPTASRCPQNYKNIKDVIFKKCGSRRGLEQPVGNHTFCGLGGPLRATARSAAPTANLNLQNHKHLQDVTFKTCVSRRVFAKLVGNHTFCVLGGPAS